MESGVELFSFSFDIFTEGGSVEDITIFISRGDSSFSGGLSLLDVLVIHQVLLVLLGTPNNLESWVVVLLTGLLLGLGIDNDVLRVRIATLGAVSVLFEEHTWSASFAALKTRLAHTGKGDGLESLNKRSNISGGLVKLQLLLFGSLFFESIGIVGSVTLSGSGFGIGFVGSENSELLGFLLLLISSLLGLSEQFLDVGGHFRPSDRGESLWALGDTLSLLADRVDGEELGRTALVAL